MVVKSIFIFFGVFLFASFMFVNVVVLWLFFG